MTNLGRNDPCHCGSGKKYKKCCLKKDQEAERLARQIQRVNQPLAASTPTAPSFDIPEPEPPPPDPLREAVDALWEELEASNYEEQIALFYKTLDERPELLDGEMAFEFLNVIYYASVERDERDRFEELAEALREKLPEVYTAEAGYILDWRITNALVDGRYSDVQSMAKAMAQDAEKNIDEFFKLMDQLAYHNQLAILIEATRIAWPQVKDSTEILGIGEFAKQAVDYIVFDYVTRTAEPDGGDPDLLAQISPYMTANPEPFSEYIATLAGNRKRDWTIDDFEFESKGGRDRSFWDDDEEIDEDLDEGRQNLLMLTQEFLSYLYHEEQVPFSKGELARVEIYRYILMRADGDLEPEPSLFGPPVSTKRHKRREKSGPRPTPHPLCPDRGTLDRFLARLFGILNPQYYKATTTLELVPAWLRYLESRHLIEAEQREQTLDRLRGLDTEFLKALENYSDPALRQAIEGWREDADGG